MMTFMTVDALRKARHQRRLKRAFGQRLDGQNVGVKEFSDKIWLVSFMDYDLGFFDQETGRLGTAENPFAAKVFAGSGIKRYLCVRNGPTHIGCRQ
jgi:hypothetical protein